MFLPQEASETQSNLNEIARWTDENMMSINITKTKYMIFTRSRTDFATRLMVNGHKMYQVTEQKVCGAYYGTNYTITLQKTDFSNPTK